MNYRHLYHAGNFADVVKHVFLTALLIGYARKPTPFCYIDTHAGAAYYDLFSEFALKNKEYAGGIEKVIQNEPQPAIVRRYLYCVHRINNQLTGSRYASLRYYPGSPMIARYLLRGQDRMIVSELQPQEYQALRQAFLGDKQVSVHHMDGFLGLKAFLPPRERRGLALIDPPYENPDEYIRIAHTLPFALQRWQTGQYMIWFPIKDQKQVEKFSRILHEQLKREILFIELTIYPDLPGHLNGCGLAIVNPPWQFDAIVAEILPWLWETLTINKQGGFRTYVLK